MVLNPNSGICSTRRCGERIQHMNDPQQQNQAGEGDAVDVGFRLGGGVPPRAHAGGDTRVPGAAGRLAPPG